MSQLLMKEGTIMKAHPRHFCIVALPLLLLVSTTAHADLGARITLPICDTSVLPPTFVVQPFQFGWYENPNPAYFWSIENMDWGDDNVVFLVKQALCVGNASVATVETTDLPASGPRPILHVHGFFNNLDTSNVSGQVTIRELHGTEPLTLAIQVSDGVSWQDVAVRSVSTCDGEKSRDCARTLGIAATVPANSDVRMELRADGAVPGYVQVYAATLFGTECFPDVSNPGMCLH
jgi:hypothetical protein